jgi:hypothetical protein
MGFSMNIPHDINVYFVAPIYMDYLVFLRRLKHGGLWLVKLSLPVERHHLWTRCFCPRKDEVVGLHEKPTLSEVHARLVLEVTGEGLQRSKPIGFC